jgi:hypothetical protein
MATLHSGLLRGTCLVAAIATAALWARSYFVSDHYLWPARRPPAGGALIESRAVYTAPGRFVFHERTLFM